MFGQKVAIICANSLTLQQTLIGIVAQLLALFVEHSGLFSQHKLEGLLLVHKEFLNFGPEFIEGNCGASPSFVIFTFE
jgi:hypothetical protein